MRWLVSIVIRIGEVENYAKLPRCAFWRPLDPCRSAGRYCDRQLFCQHRFQSSTAVSPAFRNGDYACYMPHNRIADPDFILIAIAQIKGSELEQIFPEWLVLASLALLLSFFP